MTVRKPIRTQWIHRDEPTPEPVDIHAQKAKHLPMFGPGIVITVPLHLLMEYLELYSLEPVGIQEPRVKPKDGPGEAILLVKHIARRRDG